MRNFEWLNLFQMDTADPPFPRVAGYWWFGCRPESKANLRTKSKEPATSASNYIPTLADLRNEHHLNQNIDVGDLWMDAGKKLFFIRIIL